MKSILVGVDGSETSAVAARRAAQLGISTGATVYFLVVVPRSSSKLYKMGAEDWMVENLTEARAKVTQVVGDDVAGLDHQVIAGLGSPPEIIVDKAKELDVDVIVLGNVRMQGMGRLLGSVGGEVLQNAPCDVMIVRTS